MLTNSQLFLCSNFTSLISPVSPLNPLSGIPLNMQRTSMKTFMLCNPNPKTNTTNIIQMNTQCETKVIEQFNGLFTSWDFSDDYALMVNREGDFLFYNMLTKNVSEAPKQHPGLYVDVNIMHTSQHFVTCGGSVKNSNTNQTERIIKIWAIDQNDCLVQKARINTNHMKSIQHSFLVNNSQVVSFSSDRSIRWTNLSTEQVSSVIQTDIELLSGCSIDFNTIIAGGNSKYIKLYDQRARRVMNIHIKLDSQMAHVVNFTRFSDNFVLASNINQISGIDLRMWGIGLLNIYEGERVSQILTLNKSQFVVGNRDKTLQIWKAQ